MNKNELERYLFVGNHEKIKNYVRNLIDNIPLEQRRVACFKANKISIPDNYVYSFETLQPKNGKRSIEYYPNNKYYSVMYEQGIKFYLDNSYQNFDVYISDLDKYNTTIKDTYFVAISN